MHWFIFFFFFSILQGDEIRLGKEILKVEIARTHETRAKGLMGRTELEEGRGMLFVYPEPEILVFWMKNTLIPLSIAFFNSKKEIINILDMDPPKGKELKRYRSQGPALYALEVPQGWFERHGIEPGAKFSFLDPANRLQ